MKHCIIIGGGAAGFFGAIACAEAHPQYRVTLIEKSQKFLSKVKISGGGRCNVTHSCFDPSRLILHYPRGGKSLLGPFNQFQPRDTIEWFKERGVELKTEDDGRMFPCTDDSQTIIQCLMEASKKAGVELQTGVSIDEIKVVADGFELSPSLRCDKLLIATGSNQRFFPLLEKLGHSIIPPVPSLFTLNVPSSPLLSLSGISLERVHVKIAGTKLEQWGPLLLTHWGFSGPAILKLSAFGARNLHEDKYQATLLVNWLPDENQESAFERLCKYKAQYPQKQIHTQNPFKLPAKLWQAFVRPMENTPLVNLSKKQLRSLSETLCRSSYKIEGKTTFKQEFVTCGGVNLKEVNLKTMESKLCPGLFFAGEVLNVDGVTGGFNFQHAWTSSWIAGHSMK